MAPTALEDMFNKPEKKNWLKFHVTMDQIKHGLDSFVRKKVKQMHNFLVKKVSRRERCTSCRSDDLCWDRRTNTWNFSQPCPSKLCDTWLKEILSLHVHPKSKSISLQNCDVTSWPLSAWEVAKVFMPKDKPPFKEDLNDCGASDLLSLLASCTYFHKHLSKDCLSLIEMVSKERNAIASSGVIELKEDRRKKLSESIIQILEDPVLFGSLKGCKIAVENIRKINYDSTDIALKQDDSSTRLPGNDSSLSKELKRLYDMIQRKLGDIEAQIKRSDSEEKMNSQFMSLTKLCEEVKQSLKTKNDTGKHQGTSSTGEYYRFQFDENALVSPSVKAYNSVTSQSMEPQCKKQQILEPDRLMGATVETLFEDTIQLVEVERCPKTVTTQTPLYERSMDEVLLRLEKIMTRIDHLEYVRQGQMETKILACEVQLKKQESLTHEYGVELTPGVLLEDFDNHLIDLGEHIQVSDDKPKNKNVENNDPETHKSEQFSLAEGNTEISERCTNVQGHDSHTQESDALLQDQPTQLAENATLMQEGASNAQDYSKHMQNQDAWLKVQETKTQKLEDHIKSDWRKEIKEICSDEFCRETLEVYLSQKRNDMALENILQHILKIKDKAALDILLTNVSKEWRINHGDHTIIVWLGLDHRGKRKGNEILICFHAADIVSKFSKFLGLPIIYRRFDEIEMEPLENRLNEKYQRVSFDKETAASIKCLINELGEDLFKRHRNLEAISASSVKSRKKSILQQTSVVLYCRIKHVIPFGEDFFPKELKINDQIYPTDVREGFFSLGMIPGQNQYIPLPQLFNHTLRMGCSIGISTAPVAGTLGPFVRDKDNNMCFLTCAHVLGLNTQVGTPVLQPALDEPGPSDDSRICGTFCKGKFDFSSKTGVDAALVLVDQSKREVDSAGFTWIDRQQLREAGFPEDDSLSYEDGGVIAHAEFDQVDDKRIIKVGRSSGLTRGTFALDGAMLKIHDANLKLQDGVPCPPDLSGKYFLMKSQFIINSVGNNSFFSLGDSGSGVYLVERRGVEKKLVLIGIAIGALSPSECVVTPIGTILEALDLEESCIITEGSMQH